MCALKGCTFINRDCNQVKIKYMVQSRTLWCPTLAYLPGLLPLYMLVIISPKSIVYGLVLFLFFLSCSFCFTCPGHSRLTVLPLELLWHFCVLVILQISKNYKAEWFWHDHSRYFCSHLPRIKQYFDLLFGKY